MKLNVTHQTHYSYAQQVKHSTQYLRLTPQDSSHQKILSWDLTLPEYATRTLDAYGNVLHVLTLDQPHQAITIVANGVVEIEDNTEDDNCGHLSPLVFLRTSPLTLADGAIRDFASRYYRPQAQHESLCSLMGELLLKMPYNPGTTTVKDSASQAFSAQTGVCQDHTPVAAVWAFRRATSAAIFTRKIRHTWPCTPGQKPGWMTAGRALMSPITPVNRISI